MKKRGAGSYFVIAVVLFALLHVSKERFSWVRSALLLPGELLASFGGLSEGEMDRMQLRMENYLLKEQLAEIKEWLSLEDRVEEQCKRIEELTQRGDYREFYARRIAELRKLLEGQTTAVVAKVVFRDPAFWSSGLWIDKGEETNRIYGRKIIAKNSPVVLGTTLVGIVEEVEEERSYVRLLTDSTLTPAVRAVRYGEQDRVLWQALQALEYECSLRTDISVDSSLFQKIKEGLPQEGKGCYLAKGEVRGSSYSLWRARRSKLRGVGFNYEFSDAEGYAQEIHEKRKEPLLKVGDLLITSGLDGLFPAHLMVGSVTKIFPLKEGAVAFELEAEMSAPHIDQLRFLQILPPL